MTRGLNERSVVGQASSTYDAFGHFVRSQPDVFALTVNGAHQLVEQFPGDRYEGLHHVTERCPGSAVQPTPDGSAPTAVPGVRRGRALPRRSPGAATDRTSCSPW